MLSLKKLYHPSGLTGGVKGIKEEHTCPCGCDPTRKLEAFQLSAEQMGIKGTPGILAVAEVKRRAKKNETKQVARSRPWKGAVMTTGEAELLSPSKYDKDGEILGCTRSRCRQVHVERDGIGGFAKGLFHLKMCKVRIYTMPNGAQIKVKADKRMKV